MENILPTNEYTEVEGRYYSNPQVAIDETNTFIDNLRSSQGQQNQEITQQTQRLGTDVPTNLGGLTGAESYFTSRYQVPQTNAVVSNLKAAAQAAALNEVLANEQAIWKKRYQDAYRKYQKSAYDKANRSYGGGGNSDAVTPDESGKGEVEKKATDADTTVTYDGAVHVTSGQNLVIGPDGIAQGYIDGNYVEIKPGQVYKPPLNLTPTNSIGEPSPLAPVNALQRK